jgi:CubicO group peptidase (beta-lactamase class C family)
MRTRFLTALCLSVVVHSSSAAAPEALQNLLRLEIIAGMKNAHVPGVAVAMVKDGKVLFSGGFGVRKAGSEDRVDADRSVR